MPEELLDGFDVGHCELDEENLARATWCDEVDGVTVYQVCTGDEVCAPNAQGLYACIVPEIAGESCDVSTYVPSCEGASWQLYCQDGMVHSARCEGDRECYEYGGLIGGRCLPLEGSGEDCGGPCELDGERINADGVCADDWTEVWCSDGQLCAATCASDKICSEVPLSGELSGIYACWDGDPNN
jgi:hypothetical protein